MTTYPDEPALDEPGMNGAVTIRQQPADDEVKECITYGCDRPALPNRPRCEGDRCGTRYRRCLGCSQWFHINEGGASRDRCGPCRGTTPPAPGGPVGNGGALPDPPTLNLSGATPRPPVTTLTRHGSFMVCGGSRAWALDPTTGLTIENAPGGITVADLGGRSRFLPGVALHQLVAALDQNR